MTQAPSPRIGGVSFTIDGIAYIGFGEKEAGELLNDLWKYNLI